MFQENVDLQLEAIYRQRLAEVSQAIKSRLVSIYVLPYLLVVRCNYSLHNCKWQ